MSKNCVTSFIDKPLPYPICFSSGKFGRVLKCRHREENVDVYYAAKFVLCSKREDRRNVEREVEIMNKLNDPKLLYLYDAYDNGRNELCLVTE